MYFAHIQDNKIISCGVRVLNEDILNIPIDEEVLQNIKEYKFVAPNKIVKKSKKELQKDNQIEQAKLRIEEIKIRLNEIDSLCLRSSRAVALCISLNKTPDEEDLKLLSDYENEAISLRGELNTLEESI